MTFFAQQALATAVPPPFTYQKATARVQFEVALKIIQVQTPGSVLGDLNDVGAALPPREDVGVVLERPDEDHGPVPARGEGNEKDGHK